jgi:hypothetical protein
MTPYFAGLRVTRLVPSLPTPASMPALMPPRIMGFHNEPFLPVGLLSPRVDVQQQASLWLLDGAEELGLSEQEVFDTIARAERSALDVEGLLWPHCLTSRAAANALLEILPASHEWVVLGVGLMGETADALIAELGAPTLKGSAPSLALQRAPMPEGGEFLGFDLREMNSEYELGCSGHCCGVEQRVFEQMHVRPNQHGLIERWEDARTAAERANREQWGEPAPYWPVAFYRYPRGGDAPIGQRS